MPEIAFSKKKKKKKKNLKQKKEYKKKKKKKKKSKYEILNHLSFGPKNHLYFIFWGLL